MLTFEDCPALCELTEEKVGAVAAHEHLPAVAALELSECIIHAAGGERRIQGVILDDIMMAARARRDPLVARRLKITLRRLLEWQEARHGTH